MKTACAIVIAAAVAGASGLPACATSTVRGVMDVGGVGPQYLVDMGGVTSSHNNKTITLEHNHGGYLGDKCEDGYHPDMYSHVKLLGKTINFTVDVSQLSCGCNGAFYLVAMPAAVPGTRGDYYCDANQVGGNWCTEMDLFEANSVGLAVTPHRCYSANSCDKSGCGTNFRTLGYGPNGEKIDTARPFTVAVSFLTGTSGKLSQVKTAISQPGKPGITTSNVCSQGESYLSAMTDALANGMVPTFSLWGTTMTWLDGCPASKTCNTAGKFVLGDINVY